MSAFVVGQVTFLVLCVALSIIITFFWLRTGGSVWPAILIHGGTNVWSKALGGPLNARVGTDARTAIVILAAVVIVATTRARLGRRLP
jgi:membrane protease YdiL (CAAX protease family)